MKPIISTVRHAEVRKAKAANGLLAALLAFAVFAFAPASADTAPAGGAATAEVAVPVPALIRELPAADYDRKAEISVKLAESGDPHALAIIAALADGKLFSRTDGTVVLQPNENRQAYVDPLTDAPVVGVAEGDLTKINVNNRLRRDLRSLSSRLSLTSTDAAVRRAAAADAFSSHDEESLPVIETALAKEPEADIRKVLAEARASILLQSDSSSEGDKLTAIETLRARGDQDALSVLIGAAGSDDKAVAEAAGKAVARVQSDLAYWNQLQNVYYGLSLGSVLLLAAIGLAITFGVMGVINMAHGEMIMLGAYTTFVVQQMVAAHAPGIMGWAL
ncbi:ABC transporter permease subunit, partial [Parvibaculum sp.]|uniref:ABC transporter permease subunit n=1 Tax=Parvibaculum sp. TaxID=2024848 RepID=UPI002C463F3E|nr:urea ABC transporter permease subunit UrtB [Parvibaculum sp.]